jgi:diphthine-ammonia ligase
MVSVELTSGHVLSYRRTETETVIHSDSDFATVAYLRVKTARLDQKAIAPLPVAVPELLEDEFEQINNAALQRDTHSARLTGLASPFISQADIQAEHLATTSTKQYPWVAIGGIQSAGSPEQSIEDEVRECFSQIQRMFSLSFDGLP